MDRSFGINGSTVVSEIIDGEAIMIHQASGNYFSAAGVGCQIWRWVGEGRTRDQMLGLLATKFARDPAEMAAAVDSFLAELLTHRLIHETGEGARPTPAAATETSIDMGEDFAPPVLNVYADMRDVLLLDPIHEVEEEAGWPMPKRTGAEP